MPHPRNDGTKAPTLYLTSAQVRRRYGGISEMTLHRWRRDVGLGFPAPALTVRTINYWSITDLDAWDAANRAKVTG